MNILRKLYRIFCEVGTITVLLYERPEYRDVHDDYDLIESTLATLTTGQSIDVEHVHIAVVGMIQHPKVDIFRSENTRQ